jgi:hypothetical protein
MADKAMIMLIPMEIMIRAVCAIYLTKTIKNKPRIKQKESNKTT